MIKGYIFTKQSKISIEPGDFPENCSLKDACQLLKEARELTKDDDDSIMSWMITNDEYEFRSDGWVC